MIEMVFKKTIPNAYYDLDAHVYETKSDNQVILELNNGYFFLENMDIEDLTADMLFQMGEQCLLDDLEEPEQYYLSLQENMLVIENSEDTH